MITEPNVKVNLGLKVLRKREDGYHDLETLFVPYFGIHDVLEIIKGDDFSKTSASLAKRYGHGMQEVERYGHGMQEVERYDNGEEHSDHGDLSAEAIPVIAQAISEDGKLMITIARKEGVDWDPLKDLTAKAYYLLDKEFGLGPVKIYLEKTSPVGAGLGGGSADAAFALKMLSDLFDLNLSEEALAGFAAQLGSDCAFFVYNRPMIGEGRGEILTPYPLKGIDYGQTKERSGNHIPAEECRFILKVVVPEGITVSTAEAYKGIVPAVPEQGLRTLLQGEVESWKGTLANDFEATVFKAHPELAAIKKSLYDCGAVYASMSGSGSALFGIYSR